MAEIVFCRVNRPTHDKLPQDGHALAWNPDGWEWSQAEREHPDWVIVRADLTPIECDALCAPTKNVRAYRLNIEANGNDIVNLDADELRAQMVVTQ